MTSIHLDLVIRVHSIQRAVSPKARTVYMKAIRNITWMLMSCMIALYLLKDLIYPNYLLEIRRKSMRQVRGY